MNPLARHHFRSVIFLNNVAVALLERHCYDQAHATIQDAAKLLMQLHELGPQVSNALSSKMEESIHAANRRLAQPEISTLNVPYHFMYSHNFLGSAFPLRLDPENHDSLNSANNCVALDFAIVTHNTAFSFFCQACLAQTVDEAEILAATSIGLFQSACDKLAGYGGPWSSAHTSTSVNIMTALAKAFFAAGQVEEMGACVSRLEALRESTNKLQALQGVALATCAIGAAAA